MGDNNIHVHQSFAGWPMWKQYQQMLVLPSISRAERVLMPIDVKTNWKTISFPPVYFIARKVSLIAAPKADSEVLLLWNIVGIPSRSNSKC
ncbi:unnamed protein product [Lathyrus oleraceus]